MLDEGYRDIFNKWRLTQLLLLRDRADEDGTVKAVLELLAQVPLPRLLEVGSPFFWLNVLRFHLDSSSSVDLGVARVGLATTAADAYLGETPAGTEFPLPTPVGGPDGTYPLPVRGSLEPPTGRPVLRHLGDGAIQWSDGEPFEPEAWSVPIPGHPGSRLLLSDAAEFFEDSYRHKIFAQTPSPEGLAQRIGEALRLIGSVSPALADRVTGNVCWYVPLSSRDPQTHHSFSAATLFGVIFLSDSYQPTRLAEALVHEFHHNELYMLMAVEELFDDVDGEIFYSPWRDDPRPLTGLFHAIHVFTHVKRFICGLLESGEAGDDTRRLKALDRTLTWRLHVAISQLPMHRLTEAGREVIRDSQCLVQLSDSDLSGEPPAPVVRHANDWLDRNSPLAVRDWSPQAGQ